MKAFIMISILLASALANADTFEWQPIETAPKNTYVLVSAGYNKLPGFEFATPYRTTYLAYWAEFLSADHAKEWRDASSHQKLPYKVFKWMPVPRETIATPEPPK